MIFAWGQPYLESPPCFLAFLSPLLNNDNIRTLFSMPWSTEVPGFVYYSLCPYAQTLLLLDYPLLCLTGVTTLNCRQLTQKGTSLFYYKEDSLHQSQCIFWPLWEKVSRELLFYISSNRTPRVNGRENQSALLKHDKKCMFSFRSSWAENSETQRTLKGTTLLAVSSYVQFSL